MCNMLYVKGLKYNKLSISHLCDIGLEVIFKPNICEIIHTSYGKMLFTR